MKSSILVKPAGSGMRLINFHATILNGGFLNQNDTVQLQNTGLGMFYPD